MRKGHDSDADTFIALIARCWADYPNCPLDVDGEAPELRSLATYYEEAGGAVWLTDDGSGMIAARPTTPTIWEICRVYVHPDHHGTGLGPRLLATAETHARAAGAITLELWTDTRFARAHRFYAKNGYSLTGLTRELHDLGQTTENHYRKAVHPLDNS